MASNSTYNRQEYVNNNKREEWGQDPDQPFTYPHLEWRALCTLCDDKAWAEYGYQFTEDIFSTPERRKIYNAIKATAEEGKPLDVVHVAQTLHFDIGTSWLEWFISDTCKTYFLPYWLHELKVMAKKREYDNTFKAGAMLLADNSISTDTINERLRQVMEDSPVQEVATLGDALVEVRQEIDKNRSATVVGTYTGFRDLDMVGGFQGGDFIILAGDTSNGKTAFALSITLNAIREKNKIAYYSLEMPKKRLAARLISMHRYFSSLTSSRILRDKLWDDEIEAIEKIIAIMPQTELLFDDKATIKFDDLLGSIRMMAKKYNVKGVVIDYLQILNVTSKGKDTQEQMMAQVARRLKNVAMECNIWVMALSQLNRDRNRPEPTLARLRDSGQIAEAADIVMLIYRPELYGLGYTGEHEGKMTKDTAQIDIAKGRDIGTKKFLVGFEPQYTYFFDKEVEKDPNAPASDTEPKKGKYTQPQAPEPEPEKDLPF